MSDASLSNLLHPGNGRIPPHPADRSIGNARLGTVAGNPSNSDVAGDMTVCGLQGKGKTAVLRHLAGSHACDGMQPPVRQAGLVR